MMEFSLRDASPSPPRDLEIPQIKYLDSPDFLDTTGTITKCRHNKNNNLGTSVELSLENGIESHHSQIQIKTPSVRFSPFCQTFHHQETEEDDDDDHHHDLSPEASFELPPPPPEASDDKHLLPDPTTSSADGNFLSQSPKVKPFRVAIYLLVKYK